MRCIFNAASQQELSDGTPVIVKILGQPLCNKENRSECLQVWICLTARGDMMSKGKKNKTFHTVSFRSN